MLLLVVSPMLVDMSSIQNKTMPSRQKRGGADNAAEAVRGILAGGQETPGDVRGCAFQGGCRNGRCWAGCDATVVDNEWCYTTRGYSQDYRYIGCGQDHECDKCWKCAGPCSI